MSAAEPSRPALTNLAIWVDPTKLAALLKYEPSPLTYEKVSGHRVPIARLVALIVYQPCISARNTSMGGGVVIRRDVSSCSQSAHEEAMENLLG